MGWLSLFTWCLVAVSSAVATERENGILYDHTAIKLRQWDVPPPMRSNGYPNQAPHDLVQTWRYHGVPGSEGITAIQIICNTIYVAKAPGRNDCGEFKLTITNGDINQELCGDIGPFRLVSDTNEVKFELHTGPNAGGMVDCVVQAVPVTSDRTVITTTTTTTTTTPKPTKPAYLSLESYEVDSSEHGGEPGEKTTTCPCGWANKVTSRIVNGTETARNEFPFAVGLVFRGSRSRFCGGTIITKYHVLTAAHCTNITVAEHLSVVVGIHKVYEDFGGPAEEIPVERIMQHEGYIYNIFLHDISLLVLEREITFSQLVGPGCLPHPSPRIDLERQYIKIIGWGANYFTGPQSPILQKVDVRVVPNKECHYMYSNVNIENPTRICTYAKLKGSCQGDSGGPVMWVDPETNRYTHVGIVSFGRICGDESPSVHTRVQAYLDWIHQQIKASSKPNMQTCTKI